MLGNQTDQGHGGNDQSKADIEDREFAQMLVSWANREIPVHPVAPVEGEQIIDEKGQLQLTEKNAPVLSSNKSTIWITGMEISVMEKIPIYPLIEKSFTGKTRQLDLIMYNLA